MESESLPMFQDEHPLAYSNAVEAYQHRKAWIGAEEAIARKLGSGLTAATIQTQEEVKTLRTISSAELKDFIICEAIATVYMPEIPEITLAEE